MDNKALRVSESEAVKTLKVIEYNKHLRNLYANNNNGFTNDRGKTMKHEAKIPMLYMFHQEYKKYFDPMADRHENAKNIRAFLKLFPCYDLSK